MDTQIDNLLSQVYELEGLLLVIDKHGSDTPAVVYNKIKELASSTAALAQHLQPVEPLPEPQAHIEPQPAFEPQPEPQPVFESRVEPVDADDSLPSDDYDADDTWQHENGEEPNEVFQIDYQEPLRVDEKLQRTLSKDLRKAFSINDHFRFRRELFSNSDTEMNDAINMVESMHSLEEAEEYFYDDLGWDKDVPEVADFMEIIRRHFL